MDAMSGRGKLGDRGLVADFYGLDGWAEYRTGRTGADGADSWEDNVDWQTGRTGWTLLYWMGRTGRTSGLADAADYGILDGADWGGLVDWLTSKRGGLWNPGRGGLGRTGRTGRRGANGADCAD